VDEPVIAKTVQRRTISPYHRGVLRGGISFTKNGKKIKNKGSEHEGSSMLLNQIMKSFDILSRQQACPLTLGSKKIPNSSS
jgi:hypothetical protein